MKKLLITILLMMSTVSSSLVDTVDAEEVDSNQQKITFKLEKSDSLDKSDSLIDGNSNNNSNLPKTGDKGLNPMYPVVGIIIIGLVCVMIVRRKHSEIE